MASYSFARAACVAKIPYAALRITKGRAPVPARKQACFLKPASRPYIKRPTARTRQRLVKRFSKAEITLYINADRIPRIITDSITLSILNVC